MRDERRTGTKRAGRADCLNDPVLGRPGELGAEDRDRADGQGEGGAADRPGREDSDPGWGRPGELGAVDRDRADGQGEGGAADLDRVGRLCQAGRTAIQDRAGQASWER